MNKKTALIYATCQGRMIYDVLYQSDEFREQYNIVDVIHNYDLIKPGRSFLTWSSHLNDLKNADLFIYQPLGLQYGPNATDVILKYLKPSAHTCSIPYVLNRSFWPLVSSLTVDVSDDFEQINSNVIKNKIAIYELLFQGFTKNEIIDQYLNNKINFYYQDRFDADILQLQRKELDTTITVSQYILNNYKKYKLFDSSSHPTYKIIADMANQILKSIGLKEVDYNEEKCTYRPTLYMPMDATAIDFFNMNIEPNSDSQEFYVNLISQVIDKYQE